MKIIYEIACSLLGLAIVLVASVAIAFVFDAQFIYKALTDDNYYGPKFLLFVTVVSCITSFMMENRRYKKVKAEKEIESDKFYPPPSEIHIEPNGNFQSKKYFGEWHYAASFATNTVRCSTIEIQGVLCDVEETRVSPEKVNNWFMVEIFGKIAMEDQGEFRETKMFKPAMLDEKLEVGTITHKYNLKKDKDAAQRIHDSIEAGTKITESTGAVSEIASRNLTEENGEWILTVESKTI